MVRSPWEPPSKALPIFRVWGGTGSDGHRPQR
ncbi:hypothetical protein H4V95_001210 [Arthrobacter sp. CAN_C5]|nr:hypothetical protein [Arthrobacter sp. CAN_C5]